MRRRTRHAEGRAQVIAEEPQHDSVIARTYKDRRGIAASKQRAVRSARAA